MIGLYHLEERLALRVAVEIGDTRQGRGVVPPALSAAKLQDCTSRTHDGLRLLILLLALNIHRTQGEKECR